MLTQKQLTDDLRTEREMLTAYLEKLPEGAWDKESLCEGWRVRDVVSHLIGNAHDIATGNVADAGSVEYNQRQIDERKDRSPKELLEEWKTAGPTFEDGILALDEAFYTSPYPPFGTVGEALQRFAEDLWVHRQDIRIPLGDDIDPAGPGLNSVFDVTLFEQIARVPERAPGVRSVTINAGGYTQTAEVQDKGVDVTVSGDAATIGLVATGRIALEDAVKDGDITVAPEVPDGFAGAFNIYAS
jgi:uncharacterized protein (TIGR03083 family)